MATHSALIVRQYLPLWTGLQCRELYNPYTRH